MRNGRRWSVPRRGTVAQQLSLRARIVLRCAAGLNNKTVARELGVSAGVVGKWRRRFVAKRLEGLLDQPRPGAPRTITDERVEEVVIRTLESKPKGATHWSTRQMAKRSCISRMTVSRIWRAFGLPPHRSETFKFSHDPQLIEKVRDIVGLYLNPPQRALVLCADEKAQSQALNRMQPILPMRPARSSAGLTTTPTMARRRCLPRSTSLWVDNRPISSPTSGRGIP
jgi:transposase